MSKEKELNNQFEWQQKLELSLQAMCNIIKQHFKYVSPQQEYSLFRLHGFISKYFTLLLYICPIFFLVYIKCTLYVQISVSHCMLLYMYCTTRSISHH